MSVEHLSRSNKVVKYGKRQDLAYDTFGDEAQVDYFTHSRQYGRNKVKISHPVGKGASPHLSGPKKAFAQRQSHADLFDVPSSEDESTTIKVSTPASFKLRSMSTAATQTPKQPLTTWEEQKIKVSIQAPLQTLKVAPEAACNEEVRTGKKTDVSCAADPQHSGARALLQSRKAAQLQDLERSGVPLSAAARLSMRKGVQCLQTPSPLRRVPVPAPSSALQSNATNTSPRKRRKLEVNMTEDNVNHISLDFGASEALPVRAAQTSRSRQVERDHNHSIIQEEPTHDLMDVETPSTPALDEQDTIVIFPRTTKNAHATKMEGLEQVSLWDDILKPVAEIPTGEEARPATSASFKPSRKRSRLVDQLKAAAESSDDESDAALPGDIDSEISARPTQKRELSVSRVNSEISASKAAEPRITYAKQRSYLQEDTLETSMLLDSPLAPMPQLFSNPRRSTTTAKLNSKSVIDMDHSDADEDGPARLRSIHELRAAGRNISFMQDTEAIFEDMANHNKSGVGRRRSAFVELAGKLTDRTYVERFVGHGYDDKLVAEFKAAPDHIADFALAATIGLILAADVPVRTLTVLIDSGLKSWLLARVNHTVDMIQVAKDRRLNMSQAAKTVFCEEFVQMIKSQDCLWGSNAPTNMSMRLMSLKVLEGYITQLRKKGDQDAVLVEDDLNLAFGNPTLLGQAGIVEIHTVLSFLESLSTASNAQWPRPLLENLSSMVPALALQARTSSDTVFLLLRLLLNMTNDNAYRCEIIAQPAVVHSLMETIYAQFTDLERTGHTGNSAITLDLLVLALGVMINLAENCDQMRYAAVEDAGADLMTNLIDIFTRGQQRAQEAESMEESTTNVAYGYLAVMLADICLNEHSRSMITPQLAGRSLQPLVDAVAEFVMHHERVDRIDFDGHGGQGVWSTFTGRLQAVLERLRGISGA